MGNIYINVFVPSLDRNFNIELPINLEMQYVLKEIQTAIKELSDGTYVINPKPKLYDKSSGLLINLSNIVKFSGLTNGASVMLI